MSEIQCNPPRFVEAILFKPGDRAPGLQHQPPTSVLCPPTPNVQFRRRV